MKEYSIGKRNMGGLEVSAIGLGGMAPAWNVPVKGARYPVEFHKLVGR